MGDLMDSLPADFTPERLQQLLDQRQQMARYIAYIVELVGGEILIPPAALVKDRVLQHEVIQYTGVVRLTVEKP
jgi:hypothetical protein